MSTENNNDAAMETAIPAANLSPASIEDDIHDESLSTSSSSASAARPRNCYSRFWLDCTGTCRCLPSFRAVDKIYKTDGSFEVRIIDVAASFSPPANSSNNIAARLAVVLWKLLVAGVPWYAFTTNFLMDPHPWWFAYLTNWSLLPVLVYSVFSLANSLKPIANREEPKTTEVDEGLVSLRVKLTWASFNMAAWLQMVVTVLYWLLVYDGGAVDTYNILTHGVITALVWIDGLFVNRIPVRMRHWFEMGFPVVTLYTVWTVVQGLLDVKDADGDSDPVYAILDWEEAPWFALGLVSGLILVFTPLVQLLLVGLSLLGRRYVDDSSANGKTTSSGAEGSIRGLGDVETPEPV